MRTAKAIVSIEPVIKIETYVETPPLGSGKMLIGIELLNKLIVVLDCHEEKLCLTTREG
ncbi:MAG: hypothetical protein ACUVQY_08375 [Thermoproteota archaeon]